MGNLKAFLRLTVVAAGLMPLCSLTQALAGSFESDSGKTVQLTQETGKCPDRIGFSSGAVLLAKVAGKNYGCWYYGSRGVEIYSTPSLFDSQSRRIDQIPSSTLIANYKPRQRVVARKRDMIFFAETGECTSGYRSMESVKYVEREGLVVSSGCWGYYPKVEFRDSVHGPGEYILHRDLRKGGTEKVYLTDHFAAYDDLLTYRAPEPAMRESIREIREFKPSVHHAKATNTGNLLADIGDNDGNYIRLIDRANSSCGLGSTVFEAIWTDRTGDRVKGCWFVLNDQMDSYRVVVVWNIAGSKKQQSFRIEELTLTLAWRKKFGDISTGIGAFDIYEALRGTM